jgi:hypothetical protein
MALFPTAARSPRLRYELVHPDRFDPYEMYEHARSGAPDIDEITRWMTWDPHAHPKETAEFVDCRTADKIGVYRAFRWATVVP